MMAKGRLTKQEKYVIEGMLKDKFSVSQIAKELGRTQKTIQSYSETIKPEKPKKSRNVLAKAILESTIRDPSNTTRLAAIKAKILFLVSWQLIP